MNSRPRLLVLASTFPAAQDDGTPAFVKDLAEREAEHFEVMVLVPRVPGGARSERIGSLEVRRFAFFPRRWEDLAHGAIIENLRARRTRWLQVVPFFVAEAIAVRRAVRTFRPDVMHVHWIIPQGVVATFAAPRVPALVTTLGGDLYALNLTPVRWLKSLVVRRARRTTVMNEDMAERVRSLGAPRESVSVVPMGADLAAIRLTTRAEREAGEQLKLLFVGRLVEKKGLSVLLGALKILQLTTVSLSVVGDGPLRAAIEEEARGLPVTFLGQLGRAELSREYATHDVVVAPSVLASSGDQDGLPVALLEAMGAGCAVVASDLPGLNEAVVDGVSGMLVTPGSADSLADALRDLAQSPSLVDDLGRAASVRANDFSIDSVGKRYVEILMGIHSRK
ncbi:glycosyltransferase [Sanguibacter suaedae]|uniref:D-inositol 3-phosphate glycosyltransferase n=1 Tax=Sanguibacter suaedae TaxID=2795737 RepID=A0A934MB00_9MICO|nr:glycosyltransferase [Sanguibacter suaedae]MBI9114776.1 glycosyltransferase [Sanguibacter suaedae]